MNNELNTNQHYITESFVKKRFGTNGFVHRYLVQHDKWKTKASPQFVFSAAGYTQLLLEGHPVDNSLEKSFSNIESHLDTIFPAFDDAATRAETALENELFNNLCFYLAYLWYLSPFGKAKAPADLVMELDFNLKNGNWKYLQFTGMSDESAKSILEQHKKGFQFILQGENYLQFIFRVQFIRGCQKRAEMFRYNTKWTVYNSPVELPISDIAIMDMPFDETVLFILPISPKSVLIGKIKRGTPDVFKDPIMYGGTLSEAEANDILEYICLSGVKAIACKNKMDIKGIRERANQRGVAFARITDLDNVLSAGSKVFDIQTLKFKPVSGEEYVKYVHSFITPPNLKPLEPNSALPS